MANLLELYGLAPGEEDTLVQFGDSPLEEIVRQLVPFQEPLERRLKNQPVYQKELSFFQNQKTPLLELLRQIQQAASRAEREQLAWEGYHQHLDQTLDHYRTLYRRELARKQRWLYKLNPFKHFFDWDHRDYLLLLGQHLRDLEAARDGTGYHALTAELKILLNYARHGPRYFEAYPAPPLNPANLNRATQPPDGNLVMYVSGFMSDWQSAAREAYTVAYKLGYALGDIYVFSYIDKSDSPLRLSEVMDRDGIFIGDARRLTDLQSTPATDAAARDELRALLDRHDGRWRKWAFSSQDNLQSPLLDRAQTLAAQLRSVRQNAAEGPPGRRINLIANSQGCAVAGGFLLQTNPASGLPFMDDELNRFVDKYAFNIGAHGGSYLAETRKISSETGWIIGFLQNVVNFLVALVPQLALARFAQEALKGRTTVDLAISSQFTAGNYAALAPENRAATAQRLRGHRGLEIYNANDDVTTSLPLLSLPGTTEIRMMPGRHGIAMTGSAEGSYAAINRYIYPHFQSDGAARFCLESDQLIYCGYIKKGLPDMPVALDKLNLPLPLKWVQGWLGPERVKSLIIPFLVGQSGVIDFEVEQQVCQAIGRRNRRHKPQYWPAPLFTSFKP